MSDDEDFMTDRRGIKRAHESPQKINSLLEGEALDVGDECSIESDDTLFEMLQECYTCC